MDDIRPAPDYQYWDAQIEEQQKERRIACRQSTLGWGAVGIANVWLIKDLFYRAPLLTRWGGCSLLSSERVKGVKTPARVGHAGMLAIFLATAWAYRNCSSC